MFVSLKLFKKFNEYGKEKPALYEIPEMRMGVTFAWTRYKPYWLRAKWGDVPDILKDLTKEHPSDFRVWLRRCKDENGYDDEYYRVRQIKNFINKIASKNGFKFYYAGVNGEVIPYLGYTFKEINGKCNGIAFVTEVSCCELDKLQGLIDAINAGFSDRKDELDNKQLQKEQEARQVLKKLEDWKESDDYKKIKECNTKLKEEYR
jgi:hypothetical protein